MKRIIVILTVFVILVSGTLAQSYVQFLMKTENGVAAIFNHDTYAYGVELVGKDVNPSETGYMLVDGTPVQISSAAWNIDADKILNDSSYEEKILKEHLNWELKYLSDTVLHMELESDSELIIVDGKTCMLWKIKSPDIDPDADMEYTENGETKTGKLPEMSKKSLFQCYITTLCFDNVLIVSIPVIEGEKIEDVQKKLKDIMASLLLFDEPFDLDNMMNE